MVVPEQFRLTVWRKPDRSADQIGPTWREFRVLWAEPKRRRRVLRWAVGLLAVIVLVSVVGLIFLLDSPTVGSWSFVVGVAVAAVAIVVLLVRLALGGLLPFEIGRGIYRWLAEKRRHKAWSKQAAQRDLFKR